jgi:hypothetical protein
VVGLAHKLTISPGVHDAIDVMKPGLSSAQLRRHPSSQKLRKPGQPVELGHHQDVAAATGGHRFA